MPTLLALHAHPDDESSKGAGTVAHYAAAGFRCVLVTATGGEAGDILNPAMDRPEIVERLAEVRSAELDEAAAIIGYHRVVKLGYRDSGMPDTDPNHHEHAFVNAPFMETLEAVVNVIREERPEVVMGYDEHERYPHPDHIRVHELGVAAFTAAADPGRFPEAGPPWRVDKLYAPYFTRARLLAMHRAMLDRDGESPLGEWLERRGDAPDPPVTRIDVAPYIGVARDALRAHRTQVDPNGAWFQVPEEVVREVYPWEDFVVLASRVEVVEAESDLFAGIVAPQANVS
jgi:mycothiol S-conjugate amidase